MSLFAPLIIIGMHRSGTSLITRTLEKFGYFMGMNQDSNGEAWFFLNLNRWLLQGTSAAWDNPEPFANLLKQADTRAFTVDYLRYMLQSPRIINYLGWSHFLRYRHPFNLPFLWGWKDPRNTFTLPLWLELFPNARVIHVYRHGIDIAQSLRHREQKLLQAQHAIHQRRKSLRLYWLKLKQNGFSQSLRCLELDGGFSLWELYMEQAQKISQLIPESFLSIQYETFLEAPHEQAERIIEFCQLDVSKKTFEQALVNINSDRAYAYRSDLSLSDYATSVKQRLQVWGYD